VAVVSRDAAGGESAELFELGRSVDDEGGADLLEDVAVVFQEERDELLGIVGDEIDLDAAGFVHDLDGFADGCEAEELAGGDDVAAAEVDVGIGGFEAVEVGAADGDEEEGVGGRGEVVFDFGVIERMGEG
jgi:hypothetical protein